MHAMTAIFSMDPNKKAQLIEGLEPNVIRMVREMPGYVVGLWSWDHATNVSYGTIVFDTEEHARALESFLKGDEQRLADAGTRLERAAVGEVLGAAAGDAKRRVDGAELWKVLRRG